MKKEELRKVQFSILNEEEITLTTHLGYFHIWGRIENEISTPLGNNLFSCKKYVVTMGIVEDKNTGQVYTLDPRSITFLNN